MYVKETFTCTESLSPFGQAGRVFDGLCQNQWSAAHVSLVGDENTTTGQLHSGSTGRRPVLRGPLPELIVALVPLPELIPPPLQPYTLSGRLRHGPRSVGPWPRGAVARLAAAACFPIDSADGRRGELGRSGCSHFLNGLIVIILKSGFRMLQIGGVCVCVCGIFSEYLASKLDCYFLLRMHSFFAFSYYLYRAILLV